MANSMHSKIFLDSGNPEDTKKCLDMLGFLDGQTTNPSLVTKNPTIKAKIDSGKKLSSEELLEEYKKIVTEISQLLPHGSVSIEVYADKNTTAEAMFEQGKEMNTWIPNAHIKYPTIPAGLKAAEMSIAEGMKVNMTLVFTQEQAAAVYAATKGAKKGDVYLSPFIGRLDDINQDGMDLITNIQRMYNTEENHVELLAASLRDLPHFLYSIYSKVDIITTPFKILEEWAKQGKQIPGIDIPVELFADENKYLQNIQINAIDFEEISLEKPWDSYNIEHTLTSNGLQKFADDWNALIT